MRKRLALIPLAASLTAPATAEMTPSAPASIVAAGVDCWEAVNGTAVDEAALRAKGWSLATMTSADGKPVAADIQFYGKAGSGALLMLSTKADPRGCMITSRVHSTADISATAQMLLKSLQALDPKVEGKRISGGEIGYFLLPKAAILRATGSKDKPSTMIQVSYTSSEKK